MAIRIFRRLRELLDVDVSGVADGEALVYNSATEKWEPSAAAGGGAPTDVNYLVGTASGDLSAEIVVGTAPGGELGGTWASPTVDATHSGSSHASVQAAAEATAAAALSSHAADTTGIHGIADTSALETSAGAQSKVDTHAADTTSVHGIADTSALALSADHPTNATFNDHSARHEDGGADEISIQGLAGTPVELTNHLSDASAAHAASAISNTPAGSIAATDVQAAIDELDSEKTTAAAALSAAQTEIADQKRVIEVLVTDPNGDAITTGDGKTYVFIPALLNGHNLVAAHAAVSTVSSSGQIDVQIRNVTDSVDMLSTVITIDQGEKTSYTGTAGGVNASNDDVATGDQLAVDVDAAGTGAKGLVVILTFEAP